MKYSKTQEQNLQIQDGQFIKTKLLRWWNEDEQKHFDVIKFYEIVTK